MGKRQKTKALQFVKYNGNRMQSMETATATDSLYLQSTLCQLRHPDVPELKVTKVPRVKEAIQARAPFTSLVLKNTAPLPHHNFSHLEMKFCQEMAENKITNHKIQITSKLQFTNYKSQT